MSNTLTNLVPDLYESLDTVSRELVGLIPSVTIDASIERAAVGQTIRSFVTPASTAADITPAQIAPNTGDQIIGNQTMTISKSRGVPVRWNGVEQKGVNHGPGYRNILRDQFTQAMRTLTNEMEADLASLYVTMSRSFGAGGTTPFASTLTDTANIRKVLVDNGSPTSDMQLVLDTTAGAKMRTLTQLSKANEAADNSLLRQGVLLDVHGIQIRESAQITEITNGTGSSYTSSTAGFAVGETDIAVITGTGTILAGDTITFAGDDNQYIVATGVAAPGTITLAAPGLRQALPGSAVALTIGGDFVPNMAFCRSAIVLANRAPERPEEGDMAEDVIMITDPRSGISFEVSLYKEYRQVHYEIAAAWGWKNFKTEHSAILLG
ncbi:MAG: P22 coat - protein 5 family protein [Gammaproteobacteria bacterium]|nr:P22 coat - protein 5 family protein [Gammaproteobacteria bacterium]